MTKQNIWIISLVFILASCSTKAPQQYTIQGSVDVADQAKVYLQDRISGLYVNTDSTTVENGSFTFTGSMEYPKMQYISIQGVDQRLMLFTENADITLSVDAQAPSGYSVQGSFSHDVYDDFNQQMAVHDAALSQIRQSILEAEVLDQAEAVAVLNQTYTGAMEAKTQAIKDFVALHSDKTVGVFIASRNLATAMDGEELTALVNSFDPALNQTSYVTILRARAEKLMAVAVGKTAPEISMPGTDGQMISLSDFRGQYVLVSFWASWCPYCREENPHLVKLYEQYSNQNFEILGVSLDRNHEAWLGGIAKDGILWPQVSDLLGWQNEASGLYGVSSIPANVLIDPTGTIVARNLKGEDLDLKLEQLLMQPV